MYQMEMYQMEMYQMRNKYKLNKHKFILEATLTYIKSPDRFSGSSFD